MCVFRVCNDDVFLSPSDDCVLYFTSRTYNAITILLVWLIHSSVARFSRVESSQVSQVSHSIDAVLVFVRSRVRNSARTDGIVQYTNSWIYQLLSSQRTEPYYSYINQNQSGFKTGITYSPPPIIDITCIRFGAHTHMDGIVTRNFRIIPTLQ